MLSTLESRLSKRSPTFTQFTYDLPHRVHCSKYYPISPQPLSDDKHAPAPSILVYGHDQGLTVVWKGFKLQEKKEQKVPEQQQGSRLQRPNRKRPSNHDLDNASSRRRPRRGVESVGDREDIQMLEPPTLSQTAGSVRPSTVPQSDAQENEIYTHTVHMWVAVYDISFPPSSILSSVSSTVSAKTPSVFTDDKHLPLSTILLKNHIVIAAICSDNSVRLISLPLLPTPSETPQVLTLTSTSGHRTPPTALSLTLVPSPPNPDQSRTGLTGVSSYDFFIASASPDISGRLLLWRIALQNQNPNFRKDQSPILFVKPKAPQIIPLSSPALHISFNPSSSSSLSRHYLLVADKYGALRIYDTDKGGWLVTLYMDYPAYGHTRKKILGADWCLDGQGIVTLGGDGEWGIFELLGKGKLISCGKVGETLNGSGGGKLYGPSGTTIFSGSSTASSSTGGGTNGGRSIRTIGYPAYTYSASSPHIPKNPKGSLALTLLPVSRLELFSEITPKAISGDHEMLALVYENQLLVVPSIQETLAAKKRGDGEKTRAVELKEVVLGGEDVASLGIRWLVGNSPPVDTPPASPQRQSWSSHLGNGRPLQLEAFEEEDDDDDYINNNGDVIHGPRPSSEASKYSPKIQLVMGAGTRLNILEVEDEVLSTTVAAAKARALIKTGFGVGGFAQGLSLGGSRTGGHRVESPLVGAGWSAFPLPPTAGGMLMGPSREPSVSGQGKRKATMV